MAIRDTLLQFRAWLSGKGLIKASDGDEPPLRSELFSAVQMEEHGKRLADAHALMPGHPPD